MDEINRKALNGLCAGTFFVVGMGAMLATAACPAISGGIAYCVPKATEVIAKKGFKGLFE